MRYIHSFLTCSLLAVLVGSLAADDFIPLKSNYWHHWRGPLASGASPTADPPLRWDAAKNINIQWKVPLEGQGTSTPIIWGDQLFFVTAINTEKVDPKLPKPADQPKRPFGITYPNTIHQYVVICIDRQTGQERWRRVAKEMVPSEGHHGDNSFASSSPTTDGNRLYVWFGGAGLYCYDLAGKLLWERDLGTVNTRLSFGEGSSPVVHGNTLLINRDHEEQSYLIALNASTGETRWKTERNERSTWMTPLVVEHASKTQVVTNATNFVRSYDLRDGSLLWKCSGQVSNVAPSPVSLDGVVYCMSGYRGSSAQAIPLDASGDISDSDRLVWSLNRGTPYVPSPLLHLGVLYFNQSNNAILTSVEAKTGEVIIDRTRLEGLRNIYASPVAAKDRVYITGRDGMTLVIRHSKELEILATNSIGEDVDASPALAGRQLFLRGSKHLFCIAESE